MKKFIYLVLLMILCIQVQAKESEQDNALLGFVQGNYTLIGKVAGNDQTYLGEVSITSTDKGLKVTRTILEKKVIGTAAIEYTLGGDVAVLRMRFSENKQNYESTCMIDSDLDNYARLSCQLYQANGQSKEAGLEALFIKN